MTVEPVPAAGPTSRRRTAAAVAGHHRTSRASRLWHDRRVIGLALEVVVPVALIGAWWAWTASAQRTYFPVVPTIARSVYHSWLFADVGSDLAPTLERLVIGYGIAVVLGVAVGTLIGLSSVLRDCATPIVEFLRSTPPPVLIPLAIVVLGLGDTTAVAVVAFASVWPVLLNTVDGVAATDPLLMETARSFRLPRSTVVGKVVLPAASPRIFAGARTSLAIAIIVVVVAEMLTGQQGVGFYILRAEQTFHIADMWSGMIVLGVLGYLLNVVFELVERRTLRWFRGQQRLEAQ